MERNAGMNVQLKVSMFDATTLVRDEIGDDYTLKVISDVNDDNMTIVRTCHLLSSTFRLRITREFTNIKSFRVSYVHVRVFRPPDICRRPSILLLSFIFYRTSNLQDRGSAPIKRIS